jgi:hypothetical protein
MGQFDAPSFLPPGLGMLSPFFSPRSGAPGAGGGANMLGQYLVPGSSDATNVVPSSASAGTVEAMPPPDSLPPFLGRLAPAIAGNASTLMALGGGLAGARTWSEGIGRGLTQAAQTSLEQQKLDQARRSQDSIFSTLRGIGVPPQLARLAAQNPLALRLVLARYGAPASAANSE